MAMIMKAPTTLIHPLHNNKTNSPSLSFLSSTNLPNNTIVSRPGFLGQKSVFIPNQISSSKRPFIKSKKRLAKIVAGERIDYKNLSLLSRFTSAQGKILSRQVNGSTLKQQRLIAASIKQARILSLMPFLNNEK